MRKTNTAGRALICSFEELRLDAYQDCCGIWTIGWGHTGGVRQGDTCSREQADKWLASDLETAEDAVTRFIDVDLNDNEFAALVSWTFNCGVDAARGSTLRKRLNAGNYDAVPFELRRWVKGFDPISREKVVLSGLVRRREAEIGLWLTPCEGSDGCKVETC